MRRIIEIDPVTRTTVYHDYDHETKQTTIQTVQDVEPYLERNKRLMSSEDYGKGGIKSGWWHVASIPNSVIEKWLIEDGIDVFNKDHWPKVKRKLMDPDYRYLRTSAGRI